MVDHSHLSIGEVLSLLQDEFPDVTISKIRFLESQGLLDPERTPSGYRKFYEPDIERLRWILREQREHFLPLKVIKDRLSEYGDQIPPHEPDPAAADDPGPGEPDGLAASDSADGADGSVPTQAPEPSMAMSEPTQPQLAQPEAAPIWMADVAKQQAVRKAAKIGQRQPDVASSRPSPLDLGPSTVTLTRDELTHASGLTHAQLAELEQYSMLAGERVGDEVLFDGDCLVVAQKSAALFAHGLSARHLRAFKLSAEREAALFEQLVMPMLKQHHPEMRARAIDELGELTAISEALQAAMLRHALRGYLRPN